MRYFLLLSSILLLTTACQQSISISQENQNPLPDAPSVSPTASPSVASTVSPNISPHVPPTDSLANSPTIANPESSPQCQGTPPAGLAATFGEFRLAQPQDFVTEIQALELQASSPQQPRISYTCTFFSSDFNRDGQQDYAVLLVNSETRTSQFRLAINQGNQQFTAVVQRDYLAPPEAIAEPLYVAMLLKQPGESGVASRDYFPLKPGTPERTAFIAVPAIELWLPPTVYEDGVSSTLPPEERFSRMIGYGSEVFYWIDGKQETVSVAD